MKNIFVSASSLSSGGGFNILLQFLENIDEDNNYTVLVSDTVSLAKLPDISCVNYIVAKGIFCRLAWDFYKISNFIKKSKLTFHACISLQNTTVNCNGIKQIVYLHQGIPLHDTRWSFFKKDEAKYAFYKYIYPFFIFRFFDGSTDFVVQTQWMKDSLVEKFNIKPTCIHILKPTVNKLFLEVGNNSIGSLRKKKLFFYPASPELFKNHLLILKGMLLLIQGGKEPNAEIVFTINDTDEDSRCIVDFVNSNNSLRPYVNFVGAVNAETVLDYYLKSDAVLFSSYIESFGLPLLEAAVLGKKILCLDTSFSREILSKYEGVSFLVNEPQSWANELSAIISKPKVEIYNGLEASSPSGWNNFFKLI